MSLVSLESKENIDKPYLFGTHFPQPIVLSPHSQVCVLKFSHYRNNLVYTITNSNNKLRFLLGEATFDTIRNVYITPGEYSGGQLADEIEEKMNSVRQQFNYEFQVVFTQGDPTVSPPTEDSFEINYSSVALPASTAAGEFRTDGIVDPLIGTSYTAGTQTTYDNNELNDGNSKFVSTRGVITNFGKTVLTDIALNEDSWAQSTKVITPKFSTYSFGMVRDSLSKFNTGNSNINFDYTKADCGVQFSENGFDIYTITTSSGAKLGDSNHAVFRVCRSFSSTTIALNITDQNEAARKKYKFIFTLVSDGQTPSGDIQGGHKFMCQLEVSNDYGTTYNPVVPTDFGNDPQGNDYVQDVTLNAVNYPGVIWLSDDPTLNDQDASGNTLAIKNKFQTRFAPYRTFIENYNTSGNFLNFNYAFGSITWAGGTITDYAGIENQQYVMNVSGTDRWVRFVSPVDFQVFDDEAGTIPNGTIIVDLTVSPITWTWSTGPVVLTTSDEIPFRGKNVEMLLDGFYNSSENPVSNSLALSTDDIKAHKQLFDDSGKYFNISSDPTGTLVSADLSKVCSLLLSTLTETDISSYNGENPLRLNANSRGGTIGQTLGSRENVIQGNTSSGEIVFTSDIKPRKIAKENTLHISIPELSGVKSYEGGYNGVGKSICQIPQEEIVQLEDNGTLSYIAPFENWININNVNELVINNFTTEVRRSDGSLETTLQPNTTLQIKFREDPDKIREKVIEKEYQKLGDIMRLKVNYTGS